MEENTDVVVMEFNDEDKLRCEQLYQDIMLGIERFRRDGIIDVPLAVMPFAATLASMFVALEQQSGSNADTLTIAFAKLVKHNVDAQRELAPQGFGHA